MLIDAEWFARAAAWVFAHTTRTGVTSSRNALVPSWEFSATMFTLTSSVPAMRMVSGRRRDTNT